MDNCAISVTEASRNFSDCVNRVRYRGMSFTLLKGGVPVAQIVPPVWKSTRGRELADALRKALAGVHVGEQEATSWLHDLEQSRGPASQSGSSWRF
jgi:antitoxin (DNA-binding transcriptional repressor) of toxin-antitoxin stability system